MPELWRFLGIIIAMYHREHRVPHFHVTYGGYDATIDIATGRTLVGNLPRNVSSRVEKWRKLHSAELAHSWQLAAARKPLSKIDPLE